MVKFLTAIALTATCATALPTAASAQYYGTYGSSQIERNRDGTYANGVYRDRYGVLRDRYGNRVAEGAYAANVNASGFYVDSRGTLRDRQGRVVTRARAERNGWYRDSRGLWVYGSADYAQRGWYRDRNGVLRDRNGNRVTEQTAYRDGNVWVGDDGRTYCRKSDGTVGTIVGGVAGALIGNAIGGTVGAVIGGAGGALGGREIQRSANDCR
jgi:hypothetical protein